ncbi:MAG: ubiquinone/menaquinone biosynthesis methyltransferase [bacterium]|nr:ubiquinone/menaquinone biosynthesis methyltransferase [bacterium]
MFARVANRYDLLNHLLSLGVDMHWRRRVTRRVVRAAPTVVLDACTGTGDLALSLGKTERVIGSDFCLPMLRHARRKTRQRGSGLGLAAADALSMPLRDESVDVVTVAFGVRNFEDLDDGLEELIRVLGPNGLFLILEFSKPKGIFAPILEWWARRVLPWVGKVVSRDSEAYVYLPESIRTFPEGEEMCSLLREHGLVEVKMVPLTWGVATLYEGVKPRRG